jgi:hypothetical protein
MALNYGENSGLYVRMEGPYGSVGSSAKITTITLPAANWKNAVSPFFQTVEIAGVSASSMVQIQPNKEQVAKFCVDGTALHIENDSGVTTAYAIGTKPTEDLTLQVTLTEVVSA